MASCHNCTLMMDAKLPHWRLNLSIMNPSLPCRHQRPHVPFVGRGWRKKKQPEDYVNPETAQGYDKQMTMTTTASPTHAVPLRCLYGPCDRADAKSPTHVQEVGIPAPPFHVQNSPSTRPSGSACAPLCAVRQGT